MTAGDIFWNFRQEHAELPKTPLLSLYNGVCGEPGREKDTRLQLRAMAHSCNSAYDIEIGSGVQRQLDIIQV